MSKTLGKCKWATIAQLRALPKLPTKMAGMEAKQITEKIHRMEHKEKVKKAQYRFCCNQ